LKKTFYSNGKLLITGEYLVLDGALALALPTQFGQYMVVEPIKEPKLIWKSRDSDNTIWFEEEFDLKQIASGYSNLRNDISLRLIQILNEAKQLNPYFLSDNHGFNIETRLSFPREWGLGSSSTLINNIATWAEVDAYQLLNLTFGGSGYDIACAQKNTAITYRLSIPFDDSKDKQRTIVEVDFNPDFKDCLYFVYLNKKQNSREGIANYKKKISMPFAEISEISSITSELINCKLSSEFDVLIDRHEAIISNVIVMTLMGT